MTPHDRGVEAKVEHDVKKLVADLFWTLTWTKLEI